MKNYLALIRRADFIDLYKFGFFYLNPEKIVEFDCSIADLSKRDDIYDALFTKINFFESSFTYLIINYIKSNNPEDKTFVSIEDVRHIFPLDLEAKREFEFSFDEHIKIDSPIWSDNISLIKKRQMFQSSMQGAINIFKIFKLDGIDKCRAIISDDVVEGMLSDVYDNVRPSGDISLWVYLMRYERHSFYPKNSLGYFMDVVHIFVNFMSKKEIDEYTQIEGTIIYKILASYNGMAYKTNEILEKLHQDEMASDFLTKITAVVPKIDFILVAVSYLKLRDVYREGFFYDESFIEKCKVVSGESFYLASYMLGLVLSYDKIYSAFYRSIPLAIYKSREEMETILRRRQEESEIARYEMEQFEKGLKKEKKKRKKNIKESENHLVVSNPDQEKYN